MNMKKNHRILMTSLALIVGLSKGRYDRIRVLSCGRFTMCAFILMGVCYVACALSCHGDDIRKWPVTCEGTYRLHLQGVDRNKSGEYFWSFTEELVKTDSHGKLLKKVEAVKAPLHNGDLCCYDGKIYVSCARITNYEKPCEGCSIRVYSQETLDLMKEYPISKQVGVGCDGICTTPTGFAIGVLAGAQKNSTCSMIYECDHEFRLKNIYRYEHKPLYSGIQCMKRLPEGGYLCGLYSNLLLLLDSEFKLMKQLSWDGSVGIVPLGGGEILFARHHKIGRENGCWEAHLEQKYLKDLKEAPNMAER